MTAAAIPEHVAENLRGKLLTDWHAGPGCRYFRTGDEVRVDGIVGGRFTVQGFRYQADAWVAELYGGKPGRARGLRTVAAERLRRV